MPTTPVISFIVSALIVAGFTTYQYGQYQPLVDQSAQVAATASINSIVESATAYYEMGQSWTDALAQAQGESLQSDSTTVSGSTITWTQSPYCYDATVTPGSSVTVAPC